MLDQGLRNFWAEPRPVAPPPAGADRVLAVVAAAAMTANAVLRDDSTWRALAVVLGIALALALYWRRSHPFATFLAAFGAAFTVDLVALALDVAWEAPPSHIFVLVLTYSLFRWGSGREALLGVPVQLVGYGLAAVGGELRSADEAIAGVVVLFFPAALGATVRFRAREQERALDRVRLREREHLARELHDSVAHHVSAIAVQAQAGQAVASTAPERALETLRTIEQAASRTLGEMRHIVGALRQDEEVELAPLKSLANLDELRAGAGPDERVEIALDGDLDDLGPAIEAALYRVAQEGITNAARHATKRSGIWVRIAGDADRVRMTVVDDGERVGGQGDARDDSGRIDNDRHGFGLRGLAERATLLGGRLEAGPGVGRGWRLEAVLPKRPPGGGPRLRGAEP